MQFYDKNIGYYRKRQVSDNYKLSFVLCKGSSGTVEITLNGNYLASRGSFPLRLQRRSRELPTFNDSLFMSFGPR